MKRHSVCVLLALAVSMALLCGLSFADDYLGLFSANPYLPDSTSNSYGLYGSPYGANSITNPYSTYGSAYSSYGATNPYATQAPRLFGQDGKYLGRVSANPYDPESIANPYGQYGSPYSPYSVNNPYSQYGSPYSSYSARNPYATQPPVIRGGGTPAPDLFEKSNSFAHSSPPPILAGLIGYLQGTQAVRDKRAEDAWKLYLAQEKAREAESERTLREAQAGYYRAQAQALLQPKPTTPIAQAKPRTSNVTVGSVAQEVTAAFGTPTAVVAMGSSQEWWYGQSHITLVDGKVVWVDEALRTSTTPRF